MTTAVRRVTRSNVTTPSGELPRSPSAETVIDVKEETKPSRDKIPPKGKSLGTPPIFVPLPNRFYCLCSDSGPPDSVLLFSAMPNPNLKFSKAHFMESVRVAVECAKKKRELMELLLSRLEL